MVMQLPQAMNIVNFADYMQLPQAMNNQSSNGYAIAAGYE
jgi:hypothetical protein